MFFYLLCCGRLSVDFQSPNYRSTPWASASRRGWNSRAPLWYWIDPDFDTSVDPTGDDRSLGASGGAFIYYTCSAVQQARNAKQAS